MEETDIEEHSLYCGPYEGGVDRSFFIEQRRNPDNTSPTLADAVKNLNETAKKPPVTWGWTARDY